MARAAVTRQNHSTAPSSATRSRASQRRYVFLVKQMLAEETDAPAALEDEARGRVVSPRELTSYLLGLLKLVGHSPRAIRRAMEALYAKDRRGR